MLGIDDPLVWLAYALCVVSTILCVVYAFVNWNRGDDTVRAEDINWEAAEKNVEETL